MSKIIAAMLLLAAAPMAVIGQSVKMQENYPVDPASVEHAGVPKGELIKCRFDHPVIFPGTVRDYWIYIPAQYKPDHPACVYVNQDGIQWKAPTVFDNLINSGEMPVTIGVFVMPGRVLAGDTSSARDRFNRSFEYDGLGDAYVRFLLTEILPDVERHQTGDGRAIHLSQQGNDRAIGGSSSGAIAAFTAAWERPDAFSRVFSAIGTYVGLRGGERYPTLIRKTEPKAIRVFLQDGSNDLNIYGGDWWMANQTMERALTFAGYEVRHIYGEGGHNGAMGESIFADAMRWLWKGWPQAVGKGMPGTTGAGATGSAGRSMGAATGAATGAANGASGNQAFQLLVPGQDWELVGEGYGFSEGSAADKDGRVYYQDIPASKTYAAAPGGGKPELVSARSERASGTCLGADGMRYEVAGGSKQVLKYGAGGVAEVVADGIAGNDLVVTYTGNVYVTAPDGTERPGKIWLIRPGGPPVAVDSGLRFVNGVCLSPDQTQLYAAESASHWIWIYTILPDGTLTNKQRFGWLHVPDNRENAWPDGLKCDQNGWVYVSTNMGIQVLDQLGRVNLILPMPGGAQPSNCCFGGKDFDTLFVTCGSKVWKRKLKTRGCNTFEKPVRPPVPHL
ncbi:MAG TPA: SMP-30/gluconolactonase/LRE family protein [Puia sp.]|nr:SMP-30/gluconolactonase/LRE family protein [Puia sp.]